MLKEHTVEIIKKEQTVKDGNRIFKIIKMLHNKNQGIYFCSRWKNNNVTQYQEMYNVVHTHFKSHFQRSNIKTNPKHLKHFKGWGENNIHKLKQTIEKIKR